MPKSQIHTPQDTSEITARKLKVDCRRVKKAAKQASIKEARILKGLESYYKGEYSLGYSQQVKDATESTHGIHDKTQSPQY